VAHALARLGKRGQKLGWENAGSGQARPMQNWPGLTNANWPGWANSGSGQVGQREQLQVRKTQEGTRETYKKELRACSRKVG